MMTTELSAIRRNSIESNRLAQAMAEFTSKGGTVEVIEGFVSKPRPEPKAYGRDFPAEQAPKPVKRERKRTPTQVRNSSSGRTQVNDALVQRILEMARRPARARLKRKRGSAATCSIDWQMSMGFSSSSTTHARTCGPRRSTQLRTLCTSSESKSCETKAWLESRPLPRWASAIRW
ncbi:hypothetical protein [Pseudomonas viridiflava]|uniref:hypothetical protein n=1 Tax=Pseudomonas viridiflava TaxID=33069 RepID=UPI0013CEC2B0|nr:hypothetical protein [Pseudomonas viridiflava]